MPHFFRIKPESQKNNEIWHKVESSKVPYHMSLFAKLLISIGCFGVLLLVLYFSVFHDGLSTNSADWANFGSFFSGCITPVLTALNIWIFYKLTVEIQRIQITNAYFEREMAKQEMERKNKNEVFKEFENAIFDAYKIDKIPGGRHDTSRIECALAKLDNMLSTFSLSRSDNACLAIRSELGRLKSVFEGSSVIEDQMTLKRIEEIKDAIRKSVTDLRSRVGIGK